LGALGFDSAGFAAAGFESDALESDCDDFVSDDLVSLDFESLEGLESLEDFESPPPLPLSDDVEEAVEPSPFDAVFREAFWSFFPSLP
jgi:hypothetical protein